MRKQRSIATAALLFLTAPLSLAPAPGRAGEAPSGFDFCAPPLRPACVDDLKVTDACGAEVQAFIKSVFKYRGCLERESARVVREANDVLEIWKCLTGELKCR